jgi:hypothetical protein
MISIYLGIQYVTFFKVKDMAETKQETLEEASWRYNPVKKLDGEFIRQAFKEGASWQAERMYSEEDMKQFAEWLIKINFNYTSNISDIFLVWKKQFKKK